MRGRQPKQSPRPRKQLTQDLIVFIKAKQNANHEIILNLDANEVLGEESQGMAKLMRERGLVDLLDAPELGPDEQLMDTCRRGTNRRIDYTLGTPRVHSSVRRRGALECNDGVTPDHRGLRVDLDPTALFGGNTDDPVAASSRGFTSKNAKKTEACLNHLEKYFEEHEARSRVDKLVEDAPTLTRAQLKRRCEGIDNDVTRAMLSSERKVRPSRTLVREWSPELDKAGRRARRWRARLSGATNNSVSHKALSNIFTRAGLKDEDDDPLWEEEKIRETLKKARAALKEAQKNHEESQDKRLREALLEHEKKAQESDDPKAAQKAAAAVEAIIRKNRAADSRARIKRVMKPSAGGGLQRVGAPKRDEDGNAALDKDGNEVREVLLEIDAMRGATLARSKEHFHQADDAPFAAGSEDTVLYDLIGYAGVSKAAKGVVEGTFLEKRGDDLGALPEAEQVTRELAMPEEIKALGKKIDHEITVEDFVSGFKKWKESTLTSPSGRHLGRCEATVADPGLKKQDPEQEHLRARETNFAEALVKMINLPLRHGFAPKRWRNSVAAMIEKDPGSPRVERLRVTRLFEADCNLSLKLLWGNRVASSR